MFRSRTPQGGPYIATIMLVTMLAAQPILDRRHIAVKEAAPAFEQA